MYNIAIADDHEIFRKGLADLLSVNRKFNIGIEATNGKDLIDKIARAKAFPDACILDVTMPEMNGYEAMKAISKEWPDLKVLALSMHDDDLCIINMIRNGARGYALKGSPADEIEQALDTIINDGYYQSGLSPAALNALIHNKDAIAPHLTDNELRFLQLICSDMTYTEIARILELSPRTVDGYRETLFRKFNVKKRVSLVLIAVRMGLLTGNSSGDEL